MPSPPPGVENACCEFDVETLRPTYRLLIGIPGKSNAFAISKKLGLPDYIIEDAQKHLEAKDETFEDLLANLEESRVTIEKERAEIRPTERRFPQLKSNLEPEAGAAGRTARTAPPKRQRGRPADPAGGQGNRRLRPSANADTLRHRKQQLEAERTKLREKMNSSATRSWPPRPKTQRKPFPRRRSRSATASESSP